MVNVQEKLNLIRFKYDKETHIIIDKKKCSFCKGLPCLFVCPAGLFVLSNQEIMHTYEGCLECGTCYVACEQKAITWNYPSGGFGVSYREA
ncbi:MAG: 4Fe-4S dicluster domain-containing protein [Firmicutes bacterium]|nr:4Fe-4S dicluster domain-containing protein [Bacillota bacterium]